MARREPTAAGCADGFVVVAPLPATPAGSGLGGPGRSGGDGTMTTAQTAAAVAGSGGGAAPGDGGGSDDGG